MPGDQSTGCHQVTAKVKVATGWAQPHLMMLRVWSQPTALSDWLKRRLAQRSAAT